MPNNVPLPERILYGLISLTWVSWAMIGLLSGHMFFLFSKGGPVHFTGIPAILFSFAVIACAAACSVVIVDHYDKRDNEDSYRKARRWLWFVGAALLGLSALVGVAEHADLLPYTDGRLGFLSTTRLRSLLESSWLSEKLAPHRSQIDSWSMFLSIWCFAGTFVLSKVGLLKDAHKPRPGVVLFLILFFVGPAVAAFTLNLIVTLASGSIHSRVPLSDDALRAQVAWLQSMLVAVVFILIALAFTAVTAFLRVTGVLQISASTSEVAD